MRKAQVKCGNERGRKYGSDDINASRYGVILNDFLHIVEIAGRKQITKASRAFPEQDALNEEKSSVDGQN
jgi:hypothetical protein